MLDIKSAGEKTVSKLRKFGMDAKSRLLHDAIDGDGELWSISERLERIRDDKLSRFVVTLIQASK